jgi:hypothetical protein
MRLTTGGKCVFLPGALSSCTDGVRSASEEGVDCGGVCTAPCEDSSSGGIILRYRVVVLASAGGVGFVVLGLAALLMYRMHARDVASGKVGDGVDAGDAAKGRRVTNRGADPRSASGSASRGQVGRGGGGGGGSKGNRSRGEVVYVEPWDARRTPNAARSGRRDDWLDSATPVSPVVGGSRGGTAAEAVTVTLPQSPAPVPGRSRGVVTAAGGRTRANTVASRSSAVKPESSPLVLF